MSITRIIVPILDCLLAISRAHDAGKRLSEALRIQRESREMKDVNKILRKVCEDEDE